MRDIERRYNVLVSKRIEKTAKYEDQKKTLYKLKRNLSSCIEAHAFLAEVQKSLEITIKDYIELLMTLALQSVFGPQYNFFLEFKSSKMGTVCVPIIEEYGEPLNAEDDMGGTIIDIISFVFRPVLWALRMPKSRNLFILDEPFRFCGEMSKEAGKILKELSHELNFQVIMVTHNKNLMESCDRVWEIKKPKRVSIIKLLNRKIRRRKDV